LTEISAKDFRFQTTTQQKENPMNETKKKDPRAWAVWQTSGAIASAPPKPLPVLFLTFGAAMLAYKHSRVAGFEGGLFYMGCTRKGFMLQDIDRDLLELGPISILFRGNMERGMEIYRILKAEVRVAEREGRVIWCGRGQENLYVAHLNAMLARQGLPQYTHEEIILIPARVAEWFNKHTTLVAFFAQ
jgi:hypothetical protein